MNIAQDSHTRKKSMATARLSHVAPPVIPGKNLISAPIISLVV